MTSPFEAAGFGPNGRPDYAEIVTINLTQNKNGTLTKQGSISINVQDLITAATNNSNLPANLVLTLKEASVCETDDEGNANEMRMIILGSQTYKPAS